VYRQKWGQIKKGMDRIARILKFYGPFGIVVFFRNLETRPNYEPVSITLCIIEANVTI